MKRLLVSTTGKQNDLDLNYFIDSIVNITVVDDAREYSPGVDYIEASGKFNMTDYSAMSRGQLLALPKKEFERIQNPEILRKLLRDDLTPMQQRTLWNANKDNFLTSRKSVKEALDKLKNCKRLYIRPSEKNDTFADFIEQQGGELTPRDAHNIVKLLSLDNYSYSTYSNIPENWNSLLMVFGYTGEYTFNGYSDSKPVTVQDLTIYIKIDVDIETKKGYAVLSFHSPEFKMKFPYSAKN